MRHAISRNLSSLQAKGATPTGELGIHVPARVMGQFAIFGPGYGSRFVNLDLISLLYWDLPWLWVNIGNLYLLSLNVTTKKNFRKGNLVPKMIRGIIFSQYLWKILHCFRGNTKVLPWLRGLIFKMLPPWLWDLALNSHKYQAPYRSYPPPAYKVNQVMNE